MSALFAVRAIDSKKKKKNGPFTNGAFLSFIYLLYVFSHPSNLQSSINFSAGDFSSRTIQNCRAMFGEQRKGPRTELAFSLVGSPDYMAYEMVRCVLAVLAGGQWKGIF